MKAIFLNDSHTESLSQVSLTSRDGFNEAWLQKTLYENPDLLNPLEIQDLDPIIPIARELTLQGSSSKVFLDILGVRTSGTPVLIECKLWRNPQARREVIGQILEYAALLMQLTYSDLEALLKSTKAIQSKGLYSHLAEDNDGLISESTFVDKMSECLSKGKFDLIIAGDGIRSDVQSVVEMLERSISGAASLSLLEIHVWKKGTDNFVLATPPIRLERRTFSQRTVIIGEEEEISEDTPTKTTQRDPIKLEKNKIFWQEFIESCVFDHPDQEPPRRLNVNSIRVPFPEPVGWVTCYRVASGRKRIGIFMHFGEAAGLETFDKLEQKREMIEEELTGVVFAKDDKEYKDGVPTIYLNLEIDPTDDSTIKQQKEWFQLNLNKWVNLFRPLISSLDRN